ncbi:MAG: CapA family protein [Myxococcales bacterium]|nr:CapA family protein [Myxococcales bacterium]
MASIRHSLSRLASRGTPRWPTSRLRLARWLLIGLIFGLASPVSAAGGELVLTFGGDVCLNRSRVKPEAGGTRFGSKLMPWKKLTRFIRKQTNGHLNFINLETVVSDKPLSSVKKKYAFISHPTGVEHFVKMGVNLMSTANNHAFDYGEQGARSTLRHVRRIIRRNKGVHHAGLGANEKEAAAVKVFRVRGYRIAFAAMGNLTNMNKAHRAGPKKAGTLGIRYKKDWQRVLENLRRVKADFKILSAHVGVERSVRLDPGQRAKYERALKFAGVDLIIGHHPHVVRPVQNKRGKIVFYSLGNYLIRGARNMAPFPDHQDYGLFGRLYLSFDVKRGKLVPTAVEAVPMTEMHAVARPMGPAEGKRRVAVLNKISRKQLGNEGLQFRIRKNGTGVACLGGRYGPRAKKICR